MNDKLNTGAIRGSRSADRVPSPDEDATMQAFADVLEACPAYQRARLSAADLDPETASIFMAEIVAVYRSFKPLDPYEWSILADIGRAAAEASSAQRTVMALVSSARRAALTEVLRPILKDRANSGLDALVSGYMAGRPKDIARVEAALASAGLTASVASATARLHHEDSILQLERIIDAANKRKHRLVQELKQARSNQGGGRLKPVRPPEAPVDRREDSDGR